MKIIFTTYEDYNENSIAELELNEATENCLRRNNVHLIGDVIRHIELDTLGDLKGLGASKVKAIKNALFNYELCVSPDPAQFILDCVKVA